jgi:hypothetical protein
MVTEKMIVVPQALNILAISREPQQHTQQRYLVRTSRPVVNDITDLIIAVYSRLEEHANTEFQEGGVLLYTESSKYLPNRFFPELQNSSYEAGMVQGIRAMGHDLKKLLQGSGSCYLCCLATGAREQLVRNPAGEDLSLRHQEQAVEHPWRRDFVKVPGIYA